MGRGKAAAAMQHGSAKWRRGTDMPCRLGCAHAGAGRACGGPHRAGRRAGRRRRGRCRRLGRGARRLVAGAGARGAGRRLRAAAQAAQQAARGPRRGGRRDVAGRRGRRGRHRREWAGRRGRACLRAGAGASLGEARRSQRPQRCPAHKAGPVRGTHRGRLAAGARHTARLGPAPRASVGAQRRHARAAAAGAAPGTNTAQQAVRDGGRARGGARPGRGRAGVRARPAQLVRGCGRGLQARVRGDGRGRRAPVGVLRPGLHGARDGLAARVAQHDHQARAQQLRARASAPGSARGVGRGPDRLAAAPTVQAAVAGRQAPAAVLPAASGPPAA